MSSPGFSFCARATLSPVSMNTSIITECFIAISSLMQADENEDEAGPFAQSCHGLADDRTVVPSPVDPRHGTSRRRRRCEETAVPDWRVKRFRLAVDPPREGDHRSAIHPP